MGVSYCWIQRNDTASILVLLSAGKKKAAVWDFIGYMFLPILRLTIKRKQKSRVYIHLID